MNEDKDREAIRASLSNKSFEELQKLKEQMGAKVYNEQVLGINNKAKVVTDYKRANKNRPRQMSSKKRTSTFQEVVPVKKTQARDPRFDPLCGNFEQGLFKTNYKFVDKIKKKEREMLVEELNNTTDTKKQTKIEYLIQRMDNQQREMSNTDKKVQIMKAERKLNKEKIVKGEKPEYKKKSEKRIMELLSQYQELKKSKKLKKHIEKKSKKAATKEYIKMKESGMDE